jgi:hypothetical protein
MKNLLWCFAMAAFAALLFAQERDYLSTDEADQIKEAQEPNQRMALYAKFARRRIDLVKSLLSKDRPTRSILVHNALDDYAKIIDAMDDVADDALQRRVDIKAAIDLVQGYERDLLPVLKKIRDTQPKDIDHYDFVLKTAIDTTSDSLEMAESDVGERAKDVQFRAEKEKKALEENRTPSERDAKQAEDKKATDQGQPQQPQQEQRKPPTLLRPGEKMGPTGPTGSTGPTGPGGQ